MWGLVYSGGAATVASLVIIGPGLMKWTRPEGEFLLQIASYSLPIVTFSVACLMVSRVRYPKLGEILNGRRSYRHLVNVIFVAVAVFAVHEFAIPLVLVYFVVGAPLTALWNRVIVRQRPAGTPRQPLSQK